MSKGESNATHNQEEKNTFSFQVFVRRLLLAVGFSLFGGLLIGWLSIHFIINPYIKDRITETVYAQTKGLYRLQIDHLDINPLQASILLEDIKLKQDLTRWRNFAHRDSSLQQFRIKAHIPALKLLNIQWIRFLQEDTLAIGRFHLLNPTVTLQTDQRYKKTSSQQATTQEIFNKIVTQTQKVTPALHIEDFHLERANLHWTILKQQDTLQHFFNAVSLQTKHTCISAERLLDTEKWLFSEDFQLYIQRYRLLLPNNTSLVAKQAQFLIKDSTFRVANVQYRQDTNQQLTIAHVALRKMSVRQLLFARQLTIDQLEVLRPRWQSQHQVAAKRSFSPIDVGYSLRKKAAQVLRTQLKSLQIRRIQLQRGRLTLHNYTQDRQRLSHHIRQLAIQLDSVKLDSTSKDFLFAKAVEATVQKYTLKHSHQTLAGSIERLHWRNDHFTIQNVSFWKAGQLSLDFKKLTINEIDWQNYWNFRRLPIQRIKLTAPIVKLHTPARRDTTPLDLAKTIKKFTDVLAVEKLQIVQGAFQQSIASKQGTWLQQAQAIQVTFDPIYIQTTTRQTTTLTAVLAQLTEVQAQQYQLSLNDDALSFTARQVALRPRKSPFLDFYEVRFAQKERINLAAATIQLSSLNWRALLFDNAILAGDLLIDRPTARLQTHYNGAQKAALDTTSITDEVLVEQPIREMLLEAVRKIGKKLTIQNIYLQEGQFTHKAYTRKKIIFQEAQKVDLRMTNIDIDPAAIGPSKAFFTDTIQLQVQQYQLYPADSSFFFRFKDFQISNLDSSVTFQEVYFSQGEQMAIQMPTAHSLRIDWQKIWQEEQIQVGKILLNKPMIYMETRYQPDRTFSVDRLYQKIQQAEQSLYNQVSGLTDQLSIDSLFVQEASLLLLTETPTGRFIAHEADNITLLLEQMHIQPTMLQSSDHLFFTEALSLELLNYRLLHPYEDFDLSIGRFSFNSRDSTLEASEIAYSLPNRLDLQLPSLAIKQLEARRYVRQGVLHIKEVLLSKPTLQLSTDVTKVRITEKPTASIKRTLLETLERFAASSTIEAIKLDQLYLQEATISYEHQGYKGVTYQHIEGLALTLTNVEIDTNLRAKNKKLGLADEIQLTAQRYQLIQPDSMYTLTTRALSLDSRTASLAINQIRYRPLQSEEQVVRSKNFQKSRFNIFIAQLTANKIDFLKLVQQQKLFINTIYLDDILLSVSDDGRVAPNPNRRPPLPNELLQAIPFYVKIDTIGLRSMNIFYTENVLRGRGEGAISFNQMTAYLTRITNDTALMTEEKPALLSVSTLFMNEGILTVNIFMPLLAPQFKMNMAGELGSMSAVYINKMIAPTAHIALRKGQVKRIQFNTTMEHNIVEGTMLAVYRGFKVEVLERNTHKRRGFLSSIVNLLLNQTNKKQRGKIAYYKKSTDGFIRILWQSVASGLEDTLVPKIIRNRK